MIRRPINPSQIPLSQQAGLVPNKRSALPQPIRNPIPAPLPLRQALRPPYGKVLNPPTPPNPPPFKVAKLEAPSVVKEGNFAPKPKGSLSDEKPKPFSPIKVPYMNTGCGSTLYKQMGAFSDTKEKNPTLTAKIDEDMSSCRAPLEVLKDCMNDVDWLENVTEAQKKELFIKAAAMKELSPACDCLPPGHPENGPYYIHLGHGKTRQSIREMFEQKMQVTGEALRIVAARFTGKEGKTSEDCPIAKWILRRPGPHEKYLVVVKERYKHFCEYSWCVAAIISWDGIPRDLADRAYNEIAFKTSKFGTETDRQCAANKKKTCACQGFDMNYNGASYTFGCSWTMYHNICKFCRSSEVHKFKLIDESAEGDLANICEELTNTVAPAYKVLAPDSFNNMGLFDNVATDCRIGAPGNRIFSGFTCVCDFCAHAHKDTNNMVGGATAVVTLLRPEDRDVEEVDDQQFHVLPLYVPDLSMDEIKENVDRGGLTILDKFKRTIAIRDTKKANCKRGRLNAERKRMLDGMMKEKSKESDSPIPQFDGNLTLDSDTSLNQSGSFLSDTSTSEATQGLDDAMEGMKIITHESDCLEAFDDPNIGGLAFALPHGSVLIECAKQELHATTALKEPNRSHPHRIGLVFYQHKMLHHPNHGADEFQRKRAIREFRDYVQWLKGNYVPTDAKLKSMIESGFEFPKDVKTINKPMDIANPRDYFKSDSYEGFDDAKSEIEEKMAAIVKEDDLDLEPYLSDGEPVHDVNLDFQKE